MAAKIDSDTNINSNAQRVSISKELNCIAFSSILNCFFKCIIVHIANCSLVVAVNAVTRRSGRRGADDAQGRYQAERQ